MNIPASPELSRRVEVEAISIRLADGHRWGFGLPSTRLRPDVIEGDDSSGRPSKTTRIGYAFGFPLEIRKLISDLRTACDQSTAEDQYEALIRLATALIRRAHDVEPTIAESLLEVGIDELPGLVEAVLIVVSGAYPVHSKASRKGESDG